MDRQSHKLISSGCKSISLGVLAINDSLLDMVKDRVGDVAVITRAGVSQG